MNYNPIAKTNNNNNFNNYNIEHNSNKTFNGFNNGSNNGFNGSNNGFNNRINSISNFTSNSLTSNILINQNNNTRNTFNALTDNSPKLNLTANPFKIKLKPHQEALLYKVLDIDEKVSYSTIPYGVMSDKPGSGKTYVVLALIYFSIKHLNSKGANIIVVPHNIYTQWVTSIEKLLGNKLTYKLLLEYSDINLLYTNPSMLYENDIILTTSLYYDVFASTVKAMGLNVRRVFFDEADTIKKLLAHPMPCGITWFISASINRVFDQKNNTAQIGTYKLHLNELLANECYCLPEFVDSNIVLPKPNIEQFKCRDFYIDNILSKILERQQLSFINGHDYSNIRALCGNSSLKETKDIVENLYKNYVRILNDILDQMKEIEKKLKYCMPDEKAKYQEAKDKLLTQKIEYETTANKIKSLASEFGLCIKCFKKLKSTENINKNSFKIEYYDMECGTSMCNQCYTKDINAELFVNENTPVPKIKIKCVSCKNTHLVETLKFHTEDSAFNTKGNELENMNKIILLEKILEICSNKIIIFSQFRGISNYIKSIITNYNWDWLQLDGGNIKDLDNVLDKFRNDAQIKILLIDDTSFGVGLNIEYTTDIIFFNYIEPNVKEQLIGRAQRLGRTCKLNIWELLYTNEL